MRKNGAMFICNRCRKQVFAERFDDGVFDQKALDGWALEMRNIHGIGDLCRSATKCTAKRWIVFMKVADMEDKTDNSKKKEEHDFFETYKGCHCNCYAGRPICESDRHPTAETT